MASPRWDTVSGAWWLVGWVLVCGGIAGAAWGQDGGRGFPFGGPKKQRGSDPGTRERRRVTDEPARSAWKLPSFSLPKFPQPTWRLPRPQLPALWASNRKTKKPSRGSATAPGPSTLDRVSQGKESLWSRATSWLPKWGGDGRRSRRGRARKAPARSSGSSWFRLPGFSSKTEPRRQGRTIRSPSDFLSQPRVGERPR